MKIVGLVVNIPSLRSGISAGRNAQAGPEAEQSERAEQIEPSNGGGLPRYR
jgi:hypothetical protein